MSSKLFYNIVGRSWQDYCKYSTHLLVVEPSYIPFFVFVFFCFLYLIYAWLQIILKFRLHFCN
jgi:hypothetical protein